MKRLALLALRPPPARADPPKIDRDRVAEPGMPAPRGVSGLVLKNGLRYEDTAPGSGPEPRWGQVLKVAYTSYARTGAGPLVKLDASPAYLVRHGNGRTIRGLDEGVHTMRIGASRRVEVPLPLAYTAPGLGPLPESAGGRRKLDRALDDLEKAPGSAIVFDVVLMDAWDDDADAGYYQDESFTGEELRIIAEKADRIGKGLARAAGE